MVSDTAAGDQIISVVPVFVPVSPFCNLTDCAHARHCSGSYAPPFHLQLAASSMMDLFPDRDTCARFLEENKIGETFHNTTIFKYFGGIYDVFIKPGD
jgi:hypothetical protein